MKRGEKLEIRRLENGLYQIVQGNENVGTSYVGGAASTIITLNRLVFGDEAAEFPTA